MPFPIPIYAFLQQIDTIRMILKNVKRVFISYYKEFAFKNNHQFILEKELQ
jgi:two-component SAPR family response regulator